MESVSTTKLSSKGQVVIPEEIRQRLGLEAGTQFVVVGEGDAVILRVITPPSKAELTSLLRQARTQAKRQRVTPPRAIRNEIQVDSLDLSPPPDADERSDATGPRTWWCGGWLRGRVAPARAAWRAARAIGARSGRRGPRW